MAYKIEGLDDCLKAMDAAPGNVVKMTRQALKDAGRTTAASIRKRTPSHYRRLVGSKVTKGQLSGNSYALVGYFNKGRKKGSEQDIPLWFKAYWKNYGTLTKRDPSHHFDNPVKPNKRGRRNNVGQDAENFFEQAIGGWEQEFYRAFEESMAKNEDKLYDR